MLSEMNSVTMKTYTYNNINIAFFFLNLNSGPPLRHYRGRKRRPFQGLVERDIEKQVWESPPPPKIYLANTTPHNSGLELQFEDLPVTADADPTSGLPFIYLYTYSTGARSAAFVFRAPEKTKFHAFDAHRDEPNYIVYK